MLEEEKAALSASARAGVGDRRLLTKQVRELKESKAALAKSVKSWQAEVARRRMSTVGFNKKARLVISTPVV